MAWQKAILWQIGYPFPVIKKALADCITNSYKFPVSRQGPKDYFQQGGLSCPIASKQADYFAFLARQIDVGQYLPGAKTLYYAINVKFAHNIDKVIPMDRLIKSVMAHKTNRLRPRL